MHPFTLALRALLPVGLGDGGFERIDLPFVSSSPDGFCHVLNNRFRNEPSEHRSNHAKLTACGR
jgi:hypothetical protein